MAFEKFPASKPAPRRAKHGLVIGIGWHAFVNWPQPAGQESRPVPLPDDGARPLTNDLADGQEVEILSWHPRSRAGMVYQIRRLHDGTEWWIAAIHLRRQRETTPEADPKRHELPVEGTGEAE